MSEKPTREFKIRLDENTDEQENAPEAALKTDNVKTKKPERTSARGLSWLSYAAIVVVLAALIYGYLDIRSRLQTVHTSGSEETQHLSKDLESKFSSLAVKLSNMEATLGALSGSHTELSKSVSSIEEGLEKANKSISGVTSSKADKKSVTSSVSKIEKQMASLEEAIKKNTADSAVLSAQLKASLTEMNNVFAKSAENLNALKALVDAIQTDKASKKDLLAEIDHIENVLKTNKSQFDKQTASIRQSIQRLDMRTNALEVKTGLPSSSENSNVSETSSDSASDDASTPAKSPSLPEPGELIERDITQ